VASRPRRIRIPIVDGSGFEGSQPYQWERDVIHCGVEVQSIFTAQKRSPLSYMRFVPTSTRSSCLYASCPRGFEGIDHRSTSSRFDGGYTPRLALSIKILTNVRCCICARPPGLRRITLCKSSVPFLDSVVMYDKSSLTKAKCRDTCSYLKIIRGSGPDTPARQRDGLATGRRSALFTDLDTPFRGFVVEND
jgi:hypothetical protein